MVDQQVQPGAVVNMANAAADVVASEMDCHVGADAPVMEAARTSKKKKRETHDNQT